MFWVLRGMLETIKDPFNSSISLNFTPKEIGFPAITIFVSVVFGEVIISIG